SRAARRSTGDYAGSLTCRSRMKLGLAVGDSAAHPQDGLVLRRARITSAVRCVPPQNKPEPAEVAACGRFLVGEIARLPRLKAILALGAIAHNAVLAAKGLRRAAYPFGHGAMHDLPDGIVLADSYHCSRLNTNTGRLTPAMFEAVLAALAARLAG